MLEPSAQGTPNPPIEEVFLLDPRHAPFVAGESPHLHDISLTWFKRLTLVALVVATGFLFLSIFTDDGDSTRYQVEAEVLDRQQTGDEFNPRYDITYTYTDHEGDTYTVERRVEYEVYLRARPGLPLTVEYDEGRNQRAEPADETAFYAAQIMRLLIVLALIAAILWVGFFWIIRPMQINNRLEREGTTLPGTIRTAWPVVAGREYIVNIAYRFTLPNHDEIESESAHSRKDLRKTSLPIPGRAVLIQYVNDHLYRLL